MKQIIKSFSWYLYGGVSCYCMQRFAVDFINITTNESDFFQKGDIVILDVWNRLNVTKNNLICAKSPDNHKDLIYGRVIGIQDDLVKIQSTTNRSKLIKIPKGSVAVDLLKNSKTKEIKILPIGLIEGRTLARIWPFNRYTGRLLSLSSN